MEEQLALSIVKNIDKDKYKDTGWEGGNIYLKNINNVPSICVRSDNYFEENSVKEVTETYTFTELSTVYGFTNKLADGEFGSTNWKSDYEPQREFIEKNTSEFIEGYSDIFKEGESKIKTNKSTTFDGTKYIYKYETKTIGKNYFSDIIRYHKDLSYLDTLKSKLVNHNWLLDYYVPFQEASNDYISYYQIGNFSGNGEIPLGNKIVGNNISFEAIQDDLDALFFEINTLYTSLGELFPKSEEIKFSNQGVNVLKDLNQYYIDSLYLGDDEDLFKGYTSNINVFLTVGVSWSVPDDDKREVNIFRREVNISFKKLYKDGSFIDNKVYRRNVDDVLLVEEFNNYVRLFRTSDTVLECVIDYCYIDYDEDI